MKTHKLLPLLLLFGLLLNSRTKVAAQTYSYKGMYVYTLDSILNDASGKTADVLLRYCRDSSINALTLSVGAFNLNSSASYVTKLAAFMSKARTRYGIKYFSAVFSDYPTLLNEIRYYQNSRTDSNEKFNYYNFEFEYWNNNYYTATGTSETAYCTKYLGPENYPCDSVGAWNYFKKYIRKVDSLAQVDNIKSSLYIGVKSKDTLKNRFIANNVDLIMIASYKNVPADLYQTHTTGKFTAFAKASRKVDVIPIFASLTQSASENLKQWLKVPPTGKHGESSAMPYFVSEYNLLPANVRNNINLIGYQWFKYGGMPKDSSFAAISTTPSGLAANATATTASLSWTAVNGAVDYGIWYAPSNSFNWTKLNSSTASAGLSGLTSDRSYHYLVFARTSNGSTASSNLFTFSTTSGTAVCNQTNGLSAAAITTNGATLSWTTISGASGYNIKYKPVAQNTWTSLTSTGNSIVLSGLTAATNYEFQVQTQCAAAVTSDFTGSATFTTNQISCGIPAALTASAITTSTATVSWGTVAGAGSYNLSYRIGSVGTWTTLNVNGTSSNLSGLTAATSYEFQVQAVCSGTSGSFSTIANFITSNPICAVPSGLAATSITASSAALNWTSVSLASSYLVQYRIKGTSIWTSVSSTGANIALSNLLPLSIYECAVQTLCSTGNSSAFSATVEFTTANNCTAPTGNTIQNLTAASANLNWASASNALSYKVEYKLAASSTWTSLSTSSLSQSLTALSAASLYDYRLQSVCANSSSAYTSGQFTTTAAAATCAVPVGLTVTSIASTSAMLTWTAVPGVNSYKLQYRKLGSSVWTNKTTSLNSKSITSLKSGTSYEFKVQSVCSNTSSSAYSAIATFTTASSTAKAYASGYAMRTASGVTIKWTAPSDNDADYYLIEKSDDGLEYEPFRTITVDEEFGNTPEYEISDLDYAFQQQNQTVWYKLSVVDKEGNIAYLRTIEVTPKTEFGDSFKIYPNPNPGDQINLEVKLDHQEELLVVLIDILGNTVYSKVVITDDNGAVATAINPSQELAKGIYQVVGYSSTRTLSQKLIVK